MKHQPGDIIVSGRSRYEFFRYGCATNWRLCSRQHPITVISIDAKGRRRFGDLTICLEDPDPEEGS